VADAEQIKLKGWRQGSVVGFELALEIGVAASNNVLVVVSQDCDVVHASLEVEPHLELVGVTFAVRSPMRSTSESNPPRGRSSRR
jgi:hypothetical protein